MEVIRTIEDVKSGIELLNSIRPVLVGSFNSLQVCMSKYKLSKAKAKELSKDLRELILEFKRNSRLALEYSKSPNRDQFLYSDDRLTNCALSWNWLSHNNAEELEIPIDLEDFINSIYERFSTGRMTSDEYRAISEVFEFLASYFNGLYENRR